MNKDYFRKISELGADYIFILDKPVVDKDFFEEAEKVNIPVVWIDHHDIEKDEVPSYVNYYNPFFNKQKTNEPVTHLCYQISQRKEDLWLDIIGCTSDKFYSGNYKDFKKLFPELSFDSKEPFDILYKSKIGKVVMILGFALKDTTTNVVNMMKFLIKANSPYEIIEENKANATIHKKFSEIDKKYTKLLEKARASAEENKGNKILFFQYGGDMSISSEISNQLSYTFPEKVIIIVRLSGSMASFSARGNGVKEIVANALGNISDSRSGGHENAVGGKIKTEDIEKFKTNIEKLVE